MLLSIFSEQHVCSKGDTVERDEFKHDKCKNAILLMAKGFSPAFQKMGVKGFKKKTQLLANKTAECIFERYVNFVTTRQNKYMHFWCVCTEKAWIRPSLFESNRSLYCSFRQSLACKSNKYAMDKTWSNQHPNSALKTKMGNNLNNKHTMRTYGQPSE